MKLYPDDWQVKLTTGAVTAACIVAAALLGLGPEAGFWAFMLSIVAAVIVGNVIGPLVCRLLFRPAETETKDE
jgi:hypothetical protein